MLQRRQRRLGTGIALAAAAALAPLVGCTSVIYDSNPAGPAASVGEEPDFASRTVQNLLAESVSWATARHPTPDPEGWIAINLPAGLTREQYIAVARRIGERVAPITPELEYLPTYHVGWVWMRGDHARVDVFRPVFSLSRADGLVHQAITLHLRRRFASWRVERTQPWEPGVVALPPVFYLPELEVEEDGSVPEGAVPVEAPSPESEGG